MAGCSGDGGGTTTTTTGGDGDDGGDGETTTTTTTEGGVKTGGTLIAATQSDVGNLDPHKVQAASSLRILNNVYQKLTIIDRELKPVGQLAKEWTVSDDGLTWTFQLQEGVQFHPPVSRELVASDVVYSIERILDEETGSPWRSNFTPVTNVSADGDYTVVFEFDEPFAPFLVKLTQGFVMPEGAAESSEYDVGKQPVGSGPFVFEETVAQTKTSLSKFGDYWETDENDNALPYLDTVEFRPIPEGQSRVTSLKTGEVDWVVTVPASQASGLEGSSGVVFSNIPGTFYDYVGQNTDKAPLDDVKLRQAISWSVNRQALVQGARFGYATPTQDPIPPESVWKDLISVDEPYSQDVERAKQLISESKYDGEELEIQVGQEFQGQVDEAEIVAEQLRQAGLSVTIRPIEFSTMINNLNNGNYQLAILGWVGFTDPDDLFYVEFHTGEIFNQTNYSNEEVDELLEKGRTATGSREERAQFYDDAVDIIAREAPYTFLVYNEEIAAWREVVKGFTHLPTGTPRFKTVWKDE
jgi:peptide/nickel transport system substrate-binding protein